MEEELVDYRRMQLSSPVLGFRQERTAALQEHAFFVSSFAPSLYHYLIRGGFVKRASSKYTLAVVVWSMVFFSFFSEVSRLLFL